MTSYNIELLLTERTNLFPKNVDSQKEVIVFLFVQV